MDKFEVLPGNISPDYGSRRCREIFVLFLSLLTAFFFTIIDNYQYHLDDMTTTSTTANDDAAKKTTTTTSVIGGTISKLSFPIIPIYSTALGIPQRVLLSIFGFLAIINASSLRFCLDRVLRHIAKNNITKLRTKTDDSIQYSKRFGFLNHNRTELPSWSSLKRLQTQTSKEYRSLPFIRAKLKRKQSQPVNSYLDSYDWSTRTQAIISTSFYAGYIFSQIPGGLLAQKYGGKLVLTASIMAAAILTLLTPLTIQYGGPLALVTLRLLIGICEGPAFPALSALLVRWVPPAERGKLGAFALSGGQVAIVFVNIISTLVLHLTQWPVVFYFFGACALIWSMCFVVLCSDEPATDPYIKSAESQYLRESISNIEPITDLAPIPWKQILFNVPVWAMVSAAIQHNWTQAQSMTIIPQCLNTFDDESLAEDLCRNLRVSMPHMINWVTSLVSGSVCDILVDQQILTTTDVRKVMAAISAFGPRLINDLDSCFKCTPHDDFVARANCAIGAMGTFYAGAKLTPLDLSPNYAGILMAISNGMGSIAAILLPHLEEVFPNLSLYRNLRSTLCLISTVLTSGDVQKFDTTAMPNENEIH